MIGCINLPLRVSISLKLPGLFLLCIHAQPGPIQAAPLRSAQNDSNAGRNQTLPAAAEVVGVGGREWGFSPAGGYRGSARWAGATRQRLAMRRSPPVVLLRRGLVRWPCRSVAGHPFSLVRSSHLFLTYRGATRLPISHPIIFSLLLTPLFHLKF